MASALDETSTNLNGWNNRWSENRIGWHQDKVHDYWTRHSEKIFNENTQETCSSDEKIRVLFPLCGKTVDMKHLATSGKPIEVVGVDGIEKALMEFSNDNPDLNIKQVEGESSSSFKRFAGDNITLLKGDFFALVDNNDDQKVTGGRFDVIFDRGSLVAIEPSLREDYVKILTSLLKPGGKILLAAVDRRSGTEEIRKAGPPYSVSESDVSRLYPTMEISILEEVDEFAREPEQKKRYEGLTELYEVFYLIQSKL